MNHSVNIENTYEANMVKIQTFGHHLSAHQQVYSFVGKIINKFFKRMFTLGCILIHSGNLVFG